MEKLDNFETYLGNRLKPIQPDLGFVNRLQTNLTQKKHIQIENNQFEIALITTFTGLLFGAFVIWLLRRIS
ncbi:MAG: hypothetical protein ACYDH1_07160 [Anaerolineaceae bacterium]|jgi:hypothetical protein|nr:MAG: hypothetical protein CVU46_12005 [Chloroflexi bacterium HGW-Chloroflexi-8]